jgi:hypothetical protein
MNITTGNLSQNAVPPPGLPLNTPPTEGANAPSAPEPKPLQPAPQKKDTAAALEDEVRQLDKAIDKAEGDAEKTGRQFGQKLIKLRDLRKKEKTKDWMPYLQQVLEVKYEKARYWINVVEGKSNHRLYHQIGAAPNSAHSKGRSSFEKPLKDWTEANKRMNDFLVPLSRLHQKSPLGSDMLLDPLQKLAALLGYKVEPV